MKMKSTVFGLLAGLSLMGTSTSSDAQILNIAAIVPTEIISPILTQVTDFGLPLVTGLLSAGPLDPVFSGLEQVLLPLAGPAFSPDTFQALPGLYEPLDALLVPVTQLIQLP